MQQNATTYIVLDLVASQSSTDITSISWIVLNDNTLDQIYPTCHLAIVPQNQLNADQQQDGATNSTFAHAISKLNTLVQQFNSVCFVVFDASTTRSLLEACCKDCSDACNTALVSPLRHAKVYDLRVEVSKWVDYDRALTERHTNQTNNSNILSNENSHSRSQSLPSSWVPPPSSTSTTDPTKIKLAPLNPHKISRRTLAHWVGVYGDNHIVFHIDVLAAVFVKLYRTRLMLLGTTSILAQPIDHLQDLEEFTSERSRVLFFNNLPPDTTQLDLAMYVQSLVGSADSIELWTLKATVTDDSDPSTALVEFPSHEAALQCLNAARGVLFERSGHAPNLVEVCPSSINVVNLARSAEILARFPSSKSRPRVGDWDCPVCEFSNFQRRSCCWRCNYYNNNSEAARVEKQRSQHTPLYSNFTPAPTQTPFRVGDWNCTTAGCNYHNFAKNLTCLRCGAFRPPSQPMQAFAPNISMEN